MSCCNNNCNHDPCGSSFNQAVTRAAQYAQYAQTQANAAAQSAEDANDTWLEFNALYLGAFAVAPTADNEGNPLQTGALYWNTVSNELFAWNGSIWVTATGFNELTNFLATGSMTPMNLVTRFEDIDQVKDFPTFPFIATGTTTPRNLVTRFTDAISVKDFGAIGNGVADDTAAIQAAVNFVSASPLGGVLYFPDGIYLTNEVYVNSNIVIDGLGATLKAVAGSYYTFIIPGTENVTIQNFTFDCGGFVDTNPNPIDAGLKSATIYRRVNYSYAKNIKIINNRFLNIPMTSQNFHAIGFNGAECFVSNNYVDQCGGDTLNFNGGFAIITNNNIQNSGDGGVAINNGGRGIVSNNYFYKCDLGCGCGPEGYSTDPEFFYPLLFSGNVIDSCRWGITLGWVGYAGRDGPQNWVVDGNIFTHCKENGFRYDGRAGTTTVNGVVSNNTFYRTGDNNYDGTFAPEANDIAFGNCGEVVVSGNTMKDNCATVDRRGIIISVGSNMNVSGNTINGHPSSSYTRAISGGFLGSAINAIYSSITNNNILNCQSGVVLDGSGDGNWVRVQGNQIQNFSLVGIQFINTSNNYTIENNTLSSTLPITGINLSPSSFRFKCNFNTIRMPDPGATAIILNGPGLANYYDISFNTVFGATITDGCVGPNKRVQDNW